MRLHNWPRLMNDEVDRCKATPFAYGEFDCWLFCAGVALAITGIDYTKNHRAYKGKAGALKLIAKYGSLQDAITAMLETPAVHQSSARRGDIVLLSTLTMEGVVAPCAGVCLGTYSAFPTETGLAMRHTHEAIAAWRVG